MTLLEVVVMLFVTAFLVLMLLPALGAAKMKSNWDCHGRLKQVGEAFNVWAGDHRGKYPMEVSVSEGGALEPALAGNAMAIFQVISNDLAFPKLLVCPVAKSHLSTNLITASPPRNLSYFVGLDATTNCGSAVLAGDDNFEFGGRRIRAGVHSISTNAMVYWSATRHIRAGNILSADGSVQLVNNSVFARWISQTGLATNRFVIP